MGFLYAIRMSHEGCSMEICREALVRPGDDLFSALTELTHWEFISSETTVNTARGPDKKCRRGREFLMCKRTG